MKKLLPCSLAVCLMTITAVRAADHADATKSHAPEADEDGVTAHGKVVHELNPDFGKLHANRPSHGSGISYHGGPLIL